MRVRGFAELTFAESARLSFARASERASADVTLAHPEAWVVDDRRISFAIDAEMAPAELDEHRQLLEDLGREAASGEAYLDAEGQERWSLLIGHAQSGVPHGRSSGAAALDQRPPEVETIRVTKA